MVVCVNASRAVNLIRSAQWKNISLSRAMYIHICSLIYAYIPVYMVELGSANDANARVYIAFREARRWSGGIIMHTHTHTATNTLTHLLLRATHDTTIYTAHLKRCKYSKRIFGQNHAINVVIVIHCRWSKLFNFIIVHIAATIYIASTFLCSEAVWRWWRRGLILPMLRAIYWFTYMENATEEAACALHTNLCVQCGDFLAYILQATLRHPSLSPPFVSAINLPFLTLCETNI